MKLYLYAKSGHSIGLDATRRCAAIASALQQFDPILCTTDFRAGAYAKEELGIKKYVSVDVLSNLPNIMERGDMLIYESDEASDFMEKHMQEFCSLLYKVGKDIPQTIINSALFNTQNHTTKNEKAFFFGDDDYNNSLLQLCENETQQELPLQLGHYFFLGNNKKLAPYFSAILEEEEYIDTINTTKYLLSGSVNACLESVASGNYPVLFLREDKSYENIELIEKMNIPIVAGNTLGEIIENFNQVIENYPEITSFENANLENVFNAIEKMFKRFEAIQKN